MSGTPTAGAQQRLVQKLVMTVIWFSLLTGLVLLHVFLGRGELPPGLAEASPVITAVAALAFAGSCVMRWLVLPRFTDPTKALPMFVVGLALAEACGILGIFLAGPHREELFALGVLGIAQYAPFLMRRLFAPPGEGLRTEG